jgi:hypothetical protein
VRIAVFCGSSERAQGVHRLAAAALGAELAERGHTLIYGGGRTGLMGVLADAALARGGTVRGVILRDFIEADVHHAGLHELTEVSDMRARKAGLDVRADAFIALPGGLGTLEELAEILSFRKLGLHHRPLVLLDELGFYAPLVAQLEACIGAGFDRPAIRAYFAVAKSAAEAVALCEEGAPRGPGGGA